MGANDALSIEDAWKKNTKKNKSWKYKCNFKNEQNENTK